jgi:hypothetical protein
MNSNCQLRSFYCKGALPQSFRIVAKIPKNPAAGDRDRNIRLSLGSDAAAFHKILERFYSSEVFIKELLLLFHKFMTFP